MQEMSADHSTTQYRAIVACVHRRRSKRKSSQERAVFIRLAFVVRRAVLAVAASTGAIIIITLIAHSSPQEGGYVKRATKQAVGQLKHGTL